MNRRTLLQLGALSALPIRASWAQAPAEPSLSLEIRERLEREISAEMSRQQIPGLSVALATGGKLRWSSGFGLSDLENNVPARAATIFRLASISKPITAVGVLQLVERGKIDLDAPVQRYVPSFPTKQWPVTTRQLLGHLAGVRHYRGDEVNSTRRYPSVTAALSIFKDDPLLHEPGSKYQYTTYGYNLAGAVLEAVAGEPFDRYLQREIFQPAGMRRIRTDDAAAIIPNRAQGYRKTPEGELRNSALADISNKIPGGGLCSTSEDLIQFALAVMSGRLLKPETRSMMWTPQKFTKGLDAGKETNYGLGWTLSTRAGKREAAHGGGQPRVATYLYLLPEQQTAVAIMSNLEGAALPPLARKLADLAQGG